jgi:hypothetical protein
VVEQFSVDAIKPDNGFPVEAQVRLQFEKKQVRLQFEPVSESCEFFFFIDL